jgi:GTP-binding protein HflX
MLEPAMNQSEPDNRAILVGVERKSPALSWTARDSLEELGRLADTAGLSVVGSASQKLTHPDPRTYIGSGKLEELRETAAAEDIRIIIFDEELSPGQQKKLELRMGDGIRILDRTRLILDIFSRRAHSREGKLQVELAQYQYLLPRLTGLRADLEQQVGGSGAGPVGLRGPGETQLELDRRQVRKRIQKLKKDLEEVRIQRDQYRTRREKAGIPVLSLVGYTNAGKSSLLNALTGAGVLVEDKLFATLDPTTRRLHLPGGKDALLTDTVGFIRKLPPHLVAAFRATLEGIEEAALILHVVDASHSRAAVQIAEVESVLTDLRVIHAPRLIIWNKIDRVPPGTIPALLPPSLHEWVAVSAKTGENLGGLLRTIEGMLEEAFVQMELLIPYNRYDLVGALYEQAAIQEREETPEGIRLRVSLSRPLAEKLARYSVGPRITKGIQPDSDALR